MSGLAVSLQRDEAEYGGEQLSQKHADEIALYAVDGNGLEDEEQAQKQAGHAQAEGVAGFPEAVEDAGERSVQIKERAEEAHHHDELAGQLAVKNEGSDHFTRAQE